MAYKEYREMKVYESSGYQYKRTSSIVLKGKWLNDLGFEINTPITVKCEGGRLIITPRDEVIDDRVTDFK
ncbi:MAG: SymE family type I addiction module toxin [Butyribacter sp.]|jgi:hypothetical protein|uniref:SymE family type I addiction module toxin n=1 Tax=Butyribacter sp. TaxID=2822465 RepID=UPI00399CB278